MLRYGLGHRRRIACTVFALGDSEVQAERIKGVEPYIHVRLTSARGHPVDGCNMLDQGGLFLQWVAWQSCGPDRDHA
jgi:hypothetical protein